MDWLALFDFFTVLYRRVERESRLRVCYAVATSRVEIRAYRILGLGIFSPEWIVVEKVNMSLGFAARGRDQGFGCGACYFTNVYFLRRIAPRVLDCIGTNGMEFCGCLEG